MIPINNAVEWATNEFQFAVAFTTFDVVFPGQFALLQKRHHLRTSNSNDCTLKYFLISSSNVTWHYSLGWDSSTSQFYGTYSYSYRKRECGKKPKETTECHRPAFG